MRRGLRPREQPLVDAALAKASACGFVVARLAPGFRESITVEVMNRHFSKFHLGRGYALHRFTGVDLGPPHSHPCGFSTLILEPYVEDVYTVQAPGGWTCERILRSTGHRRTVPAATIHQIVDLPNGEGWTLVRHGPHVQETRFYRFGDVIESRIRRQRCWSRVEPPPSLGAAAAGSRRGA